MAGGTIITSANETVGTMDDWIVTPNSRMPFTVLSVDGFLGMGNKLVVMPYSDLEVANKRMMLPGATKEPLKALPEFKYASKLSIIKR